ncbi:MAG TPA: hypothetical protein VH540_08215 [Ktedonobacterales bacterium]|jgi:hypothetical protein
MRKLWYRSLRHACLSLFTLILLLLAACDSGANTASGTPTPNPAAGQVVIQLFPTAGFILPRVVGVPEWTLYGDGTVLFLGQGSTVNLLQAHLSRADAQHIVDVVTNQYQFFASTETLYGQTNPDVGPTLLYVHTNGQQKTVGIGQRAGDQPDQQTTNIFAIQQFLQQQEPANAIPYDPPAIALLALPDDQPSQVTWPFDDISLSQIAAQECALLTPEAQCPAGQPSAIKMISGSRAKAILGGSGFTQTMMQNGKSYRIISWPLLPDALHPAPGTPAMITVTVGSELKQWPLSA